MSYILPPNNSSETGYADNGLTVVAELHKETFYGQESVNTQYTVVGAIKNFFIWVNWACAGQDAVYHFSQLKGQPSIMSYTNVQSTLSDHQKCLSKTIHSNRCAILEKQNGSRLGQTLLEGTAFIHHSPNADMVSNHRPV